MSVALNLLELIFSLLVALASLLGALFITGFLLAVPRNEFKDDNHDDDFGVNGKSHCGSCISSKHDPHNYV